MEQAKSIWLQAPKAAGTVGKGLLAAAAVLLAALLSLAVAAPAWAANGTWKQDNTGWWYAYDDGGYARNGWEQVGGQWYHFDRFGYMDTGWELVDGKWYWLGSDGAMRTGWYTVDGEWQWSDASGVWHPNTWVQSGGRWWYQWADGTYPTSGWQLIGGKWYHFDGAGYMQTGWLAKGGEWYFLESSGAMATGWVSNGGSWYYLEPSGAMTTGWKLVGDDWYYLRTDGSMVANGWVGGTYWMGASGAMATSEWVDDGRYYVDPDGEWVEGHEPITAPVTPASDFDYAIGDYILNGEVRTGVVPSGYTKMFGCELSDDSEVTYTKPMTFGSIRGADCGHGVYITGYRGDSDTVVVPNEIDGFPVVYIDLLGSELNNPHNVYWYDVSRCSSLRYLSLMSVSQLEIGHSSNIESLFVAFFLAQGFDYDAKYVDLAPAKHLASCEINNTVPLRFDMSNDSLEFMMIGGENTGSLSLENSPKLREVRLDRSTFDPSLLELSGCNELRFLTAPYVDLSAFTKAEYPNLIEVNGERV